MAREDEQRFKDMLKAIEVGEIEEDLELPDPEEYDDMGGIKSLDRGAPSIKLASETGPEEFELELMSVIREFNDRMQNGELDPSTTIDEYINDYLSRKKMMMEDKNRQMAMYGGRMKYAGGTDLRNKMSKLMIKVANGTITDKEMIELRNMESAGMFSRANNAYGGRMQYAEAGRAYEEVIDKDAEEEYYRKKAIELDKKYNPQNYFNEKKSTYKQMETALEKMGPKKIQPIANKPQEDIPTRLSRLDAEKRLQDILKKQLEEKAKKAKGGIAGVL